MECFNSLEEGELKSLKKVFEKLQSRFCPASFKLIIHEKLCSEKMAENESIEEYITRFNKMTQMLELAESQKVALFIANLKGILKEHVIISNLLKLVQAFECARIKASAAQHNKESKEMQVKNWLIYMRRP